MPDNNTIDIKAVYDEVCQSHDGIADFRAKLLALLPIASGAGIFLLVGDKALAPETLPHLLPLGVFGALMTLGLFFYELRGIQKCNTLVACAKKLEEGLLPKDLAPFGTFKFRQKATLSIVGSTGAALVIYPTVIGAWVYVAGIGISNSLTLSTAVCAVAAGFFVLFIILGWAVIRHQRAALKRELKKLESLQPKGNSANTAEKAV